MKIIKKKGNSEELKKYFDSLNKIKMFFNNSKNMVDETIKSE